MLNKIEHNQRDQNSRCRGWRNNCFDQWQGYNGRTNNRGEEDSNKHDESQIQRHECQKYGHYKKERKFNNIQCNYCKRFAHYQYECRFKNSNNKKIYNKFMETNKMLLRLCFWKL